MTTYVTKDGDTVDYVVWKFYNRRTARLVERVLDANPGLADLGPLLSAGVTIKLPEFAPAEASATAVGVKLWD